MTTPTDMLVDARTGVVTSLLPYSRPDLPSGWVGCSARVSDTRRLPADATQSFRADPYGFGAALVDEDAAAGAALGEAVERYCGNVVPDSLPISTARGWTERGHAVINPDDLALYSEAQYAQPGFPFREFTVDTPTRWVTGRRLTDLQPVWMPAPLTYLGYHTGNRRADVPIAAVQYAGIAAGRTREEAEWSGLLELVERDATALWWTRGLPSWDVTGTSLPRIARHLADPESSTRTVRILALPSPFSVPVAAVLVHDRARDIIAFGTACRPTLAAAAEKATVEAFAVCAITMDLADADGPTWRAVADGVLPGHLYKPFRADRRYRLDYAPPWRDVLDLPTVAQLYLDPEIQSSLLEFVEDTIESTEPDIGPDTAVTRSELLDRLGDHSPVSAELTTSDVAAAGLHVVRVIAPGLYNNSPAAFPLLGGDRLDRVPAECGWTTTRPRPEASLPLPVPLA
ncbi:YcaO-like family protein [Rhodococcus triatomae]|nr:hypothetical protein G419_20755 [Rhodococcus triatomae BKS 15-14]